MIQKIPYLLAFTFLISMQTYARQYHVSTKGNNKNPGTLSQPFATISAAAEIALPGDIVTVHEGTYREWVNPKYGGSNDQQRIVYQAAKNEEVWIKGSEVVNTWEKYKDNVWTVTLDNTLFGDFNPYKEIIEGDWLVSTNGRVQHLGEVYINGKALYEIDSLKKVFIETPLEKATDKIASRYKWYCESNETTTIIYANFKGLNPNNELVEINVRPAIFFPKRTGVNYIIVRGFNMCHAATQWSPPTAEQVGLIGPNWSKGWIIENNLISDSKCSGICIGKEKSTGHNEWTNLKVKHGTQRERDVIFKALQIGWSKETIGSHIIRNNVIKDCEQTGICGHLGGVFSQIYNNHIYNIHVKNQFYGYEIAGIKLHAAIDALIEGNCIHDNYRGIWLDWQAQGARVSRNIFFSNQSEDLFSEVNHGPMIVDNNIMLSKTSILNASQGTAFVHNLIAGNLVMRPVPNRFTPYHFPHSTSVSGLMTILTGDDRFYNNIFASNAEEANPYPRPSIDSEYTGLNAYNEYPLATDHWYTGKSPDDYAAHKLPVYIESNVYFNKAKPFNREINALENHNHKLNLSIEQEGKAFYLSIDVDDSLDETNNQLITTALLGAAFESETPYEHNDGSPLLVDKDCLGNNRNVENPTAGPFELLKEGKSRINVFNEKE